MQTLKLGFLQAAQIARRQMNKKLPTIVGVNQCVTPVSVTRWYIIWKVLPQWILSDKCYPCMCYLISVTIGE